MKALLGLRVLLIRLGAAGTGSVPIRAERAANTVPTRAERAANTVTAESAANTSQP
jgi:hypothetical protein